MMARLLQWIGIDRSGAVRSSTDPLRDTHRRLVVEPIEDRLLLSATAGESVADGGTVSFSYGFVCDRLDCQAAYSGFTVGSNSWLGDSSLEATAESGRVSAIDDSPRFRVSTDVDVDGGDQVLNAAGNEEIGRGAFLDAAADNSELLRTNELTKPKSEELDPGELSPPETGEGTINVAYMAHQKVFAEIGSSGRMLDGNDWTDLSVEVQLALGGSPESSCETVSGSSHKGASLAGSQGRLAAFDLAMRESVPVWSTSLDGARSDGLEEELPATRGDTDSAASDSPQHPTVSRVRYDAAAASSELGGDAHHTALTGILASSAELRSSICLAEVDESAESARGDRAADAQTSNSEAVVDARAVYLDERREKPVAHLAAAVGIGHVLLGERRRTVEEASYKQLPPRKR